MALVPRVRPERVFSDAQWRSLTKRSSWRGLWLVAHCWATIGLAMFVGANWPWTLPLAVLIIGTRQLGLFILMHDAAHALLHPNRRINDWVGYWLCSASIKQYRPYHLRHHRYVQQDEDPDLALSAPFPINRKAFCRKALRDLSGQTFFRQRFGHVLSRLKTRAPGDSVARLLVEELGKDRRFLLGNGLGLLTFSLAGWGWVWVAMWLLPMATWFQLVYRIRNIAEHALVARNESDPFRQARTTHAGLLERVLVAPYWVNFHCEHHLFTQVPCWNLPRSHRLLLRAGLGARMEVQPGYLSVLRLATSA